MATTYRPPVRTDTDDRPGSTAVLLGLAYVGQVVAVVAAATGLAIVLAGAAAGLGGFVALPGGWLAVVSASPALARGGTARLAEVEFGQRAPRSARAGDAVVASVLAR